MKKQQLRMEIFFSGWTVQKYKMKVYAGVAIGLSSSMNQINRQEFHKVCEDLSDEIIDGMLRYAGYMEESES